MRRSPLVLLVLSTALAGVALVAPSALATNAVASSPVATKAAAPSAVAANGVAPGQAFTGRVNGSFSNATVTVICPGPASLGRKGHPAAGQQMEVLSPLPPVAAGIKISVGETGTLGRRIVAGFRDASAVVPPPVTSTAVATTFYRYFVNQPIPTYLWLPCSGTGEVVFRPLPTSPSARSSVVSVTYVNIAV